MYARRFITLGVSLLLFILFVIGAKKNQSLAFDAAVSKYITKIFQEPTYTFFEAVTWLGDTAGITTVVFILIFVLWIKNRDYAGMLVLFISVALGNIVNKWVKELVARERPLTAVNAESMSFPSGHAMVGMILYFLGAYLLIKSIKTASLKWVIGLAAGILIFLIGLSRLVLQDHFPTDVLGGFTLGIVWSMLWVFLYEWLYPRFSKKS